MKKIGAYRLFIKKHFSIEYYSGDIKLDDIIHLKKIISKEPNYDFSFNTLFDIRDANINVSISEMKILLEFLNKYFKKANMRNVAFLTSSPNDVVKSTLFSILLSNNNKLNMNTAIFSTTNSAAKWLDIEGVNEKELDTMLIRLRTQPNNIYKSSDTL
jgi:hypothetical protein